jgi:hypothetical protein
VFPQDGGRQQVYDCRVGEAKTNSQQPGEARNTGSGNCKRNRQGLQVKEKESMEELHKCRIQNLTKTQSKEMCSSHAGWPRRRGFLPFPV